jgi:hypothetical protein
MRARHFAALLPLCAALAAACGGSGDGRAAAAGGVDTPAARRVWTPDQARALRQARERGAAAPATVVSAPGPAEGEDSARWAAEEKTKYDQRVRSMGAYTDCMEKARRDHTPLQPTLEAACRRLPTAPR